MIAFVICQSCVYYCDNDNLDTCQYFINNVRAPNVLLTLGTSSISLRWARREVI